jgi:hypothetical protein
MFRMEITRTWYYAKSDEIEAWHTDPHKEEHSEMEYGDDEKSEYDSPVDWAVAMLRNESVVATPGMCGFPALEASGYPIGDAVNAHWWLSGTAGDNYTDEETEWTIRLVSPEWTPQMRAEVFRRATAR